MSVTIKKSDLISPESYNPKKPEILSMVKTTLKNEHDLNLPSECIIAHKDKIAPFSGERWPYSNVEPALYGALGLFYGRTIRRDETGALINDDMEYAIHSVLTGHAFGLFYCLPDDSLSMATYGFSSSQLEIGDYSKEEIITIIKDQIYRGNAVHIDEGNGPFDYLIWGYKDNGSVLLGYKFEHGNDMLNCSYDFENPSVFGTLVESFTDAALFQPNGEKLGGITFYQPTGERLDREIIYRQALLQGYRMLAQIEPPPAMDFSRVHFGYGQAIYDEWIRQLEQANSENSAAFYFASPVFPHFLALYENRLQLYKFLKIYAGMNGDANLLKAAGLCEQLKGLAMEAAQIGFENKHSKPEILAMTNNERRVLLIDLLKRCHALDLDIAKQIKIFTGLPESYSPRKPEILSMVKQAQRDSGYPDAFTLPDKSTAISPEIRHNCPAFVSGFANEFSYFMDYTGQGYGFVNGSDGWRCDVNYTLACVISGHATRPASLPVTNEGLERLYNAAGYPLRKTFCTDQGWTDARHPNAKDGQMSEADMKEVIKYTLCILGQPVVISPLNEQCWYGIIVGYKRNGDVLIVYWYPPYFMAPDNIEPQTVEIENWFHRDTQLTIMGKRKNVAPIEALYKEGFRQIRLYLTAAIHGEDRKYYEEWESFLRLDIKDMIAKVAKTGIVPGARLFADDIEDVEMDTDKIREKINTICDPTWCEMAERRYYVMHFFRQAIRHFSEEKEALQALSAHFWHTSEIMGNRNNGYISEVGHDPIKAEAFEDPKVRARMADCVREFREADAKGLEMMEKLLSELQI